MFFVSPPFSIAICCKSFAVPNFLPHSIIFFQYESIEIDWRIGFSFLFGRFDLLLLLVFLLCVCTSRSITSRTFFCWKTHAHTSRVYTHTVGTICAGFLWIHMQQNKSELYIIAFWFPTPHAYIISSDPKILYSSAAFFVPLSLYCTCVSIESVCCFFSSRLVRLFWVLKFHCLIEFNGIRIFFSLSFAKKWQDCCSVVEGSKRREIIENAAVSKSKYGYTLCNYDVPSQSLHTDRQTHAISRSTPNRWCSAEVSMPIHEIDRWQKEWAKWTTAWEPK